MYVCPFVIMFTWYSCVYYSSANRCQWSSQIHSFGGTKQPQSGSPLQSEASQYERQEI